MGLISDQLHDKIVLKCKWFMRTYHHNIGVLFYFCRGRSETVIALYKHTIFIPIQAFSQRVQHVANGGLILRHVTPGDSGSYSVDVTTRDASRMFFSPFHSVILSVTGIRDWVFIITYTLQGMNRPVFSLLWFFFFTIKLVWLLSIEDAVGRNDNCKQGQPLAEMIIASRDNALP